MKNLFASLFILIILTENLPAQEMPVESFKLSLKDTREQTLKLNDQADISLVPFIFLWLVNPIIVYEDKHVDIGLTKEVSVYIYSFVRMAGEYSRIFRAHNKNHLRASLNLDMPVAVGDFAAFVYSLGGGYFTDTKHSGYFPQASFSLLLFSNHVGTNVYVKTRYTFITQKEKSNIFDFSIGAGLAFYF
jgi:cation transport ATPase